MKKIISVFIAGLISFPAFAGIFVYGDSIPACAAGVSLPANCMVARLSVSLGTSITNSAASGAQAADQATAAKAHAPVAGDKFIIYVGTNDANLYLTDATKRSYYRAALAYLIAWNALPAKVYGTAGTLTAGWSADAYSAGVGVASFTPGDTATYTVSGTTVYLGMKYYPGAYGTADIKIDGVTKTTYTATNPGYTTGLNSYPLDQVGLIRVAGLAPGMHTVQVAVTAGTGTYPPVVYLQWVAGSDQVTKPPVYVNTIHHWAAYAGSNTAANIDAYNALQDSVIADFVADGQNVIRVDPALVATDISGDNIHPNDGGDGKIAVADFAAMSGPPPPPPPPPTYTPAQLVIDAAGIYYGQKLDGTGTTRLSP